MPDAPASPLTAVQADLAYALDAILPQTQCTKCGYDGCRPYAEAMARGLAEINQCPPGGTAGIAKLSAVTGRPAQPLNPVNGVEGPLRVALIDETLCIGCTLCIEACPVDAIVGAARRMHTVLPSLCTGCDLCVPPCPMDCIAMVAPDRPHAWDEADAAAARARFEARNLRLARAAADLEARRLTDAIANFDAPVDPESGVKKERVAAAIDRARARRRQAADRSGKSG